MKFNFDGWKKVKAAHDHTVLRNNEGHEIKIAHKPLSPKMRGQLASLPMVEAKVEEPKASKNPEKMAQGGEVGRDEEEQLQQYAEGTDNVQAPQSPVTINIGKQDASEPNPTANAPTPSPDQAQAPQAANPVDAEPVDPNAPQNQNPAAAQAAPQPDNEATVQPTAPAQAAQPAQPDIPAQPSAPAQPTQNGQSPYMQAFQQAKQAKLQEYAQEDAAWQHDLRNGHVTPETYSSLFAKRDTLGKLGTMFGLILSGIGSGMTGQPNALLEMMNKTIRNDLDAQIQSKSNAQNLISLNNQKLVQQAQAGQMNVDTLAKSYALSNAMANRVALQEFTNTVAKMPMGSPQRKQAENTLAILSSTVNNDNYRLFDRISTLEALSGSFGQPEGGSMDPETQFQSQNQALRMSGHNDLADYREARHIPGVNGMASRPIPEGARAEINAMNNLDKKAADTLQFAQAHKGTISPSQRAIGEQKAAELVNFYNQSLGQGVLTEGRLAWLDSQIGKNPTSIFADILGNNARLKEIQSSNNTRRQTLLKSLGYSGASDQSVAETPKTQTQEGATGTYQGKPVIFRNGKWKYK